MDLKFKFQLFGHASNCYQKNGACLYDALEILARSVSGAPGGLEVITANRAV